MMQFSLKDPSFVFVLIFFMDGRFDTLSKIRHTIGFNGVSFFMVPKREIISYAQVINEGLIFLESVKLLRSLLVPIDELRVNEGKAIDILKVSRRKGKDTRVFGYVNEVIGVIVGTLPISLDCKRI